MNNSGLDQNEKMWQKMLKDAPEEWSILLHSMT